jgi:RNA polymerase sigma-70 factor (sigma-E family)
MAPLRPPASDDGSYDEFFDECLPMVLHLARRLTGSPSQAEDIAVEALGRAFAHWGRVRQMAHGQAWVMRVTTNLVIGQARRRRVRDSAQVPPEPPQPDVAEAVARRLDLTATLLTLPRRQQQAVTLRYLADMPEAEVAAAMGVSAGSVKKHLSRGLTAMRTTLGTDIEPGGGRWT